jgi:hypothetical protein
MSFVLKDFVDSRNPIVLNLKNTVESLYKQISEVFYRYSSSLTAQESRFSSIIGDRLGRIFHPNHLSTKDKFLTGLETIEFSKEEQIEYTYSNYIKQLIVHNNCQNTGVIDRLSNYREINEIKVEDLRNKIFS